MLEMMMIAMLTQMTPLLSASLLASKVANR